MRPRLKEVLQEVEAESSGLEFDQVAFTLASFARAELFNLFQIDDLPKLSALTAEILRDLTTANQPTRLTKAMGERDWSKSQPMTKLRFADWMDREDRVGRVVTQLLRT